MRYLSAVDAGDIEQLVHERGGQRGVAGRRSRHPPLAEQFDEPLAGETGVGGRPASDQFLLVVGEPLDEVLPTSGVEEGRIPQPGVRVVREPGQTGAREVAAAGEHAPAQPVPVGEHLHQQLVRGVVVLAEHQPDEVVLVGRQPLDHIGGQRRCACDSPAQQDMAGRRDLPERIRVSEAFLHPAGDRMAARRHGVVDRGPLFLRHIRAQGHGEADEEVAVGAQPEGQSRGDVRVPGDPVAYRTVLVVHEKRRQGGVERCGGGGVAATAPVGLREEVLHRRRQGGVDVSGAPDRLAHPRIGVGFRRRPYLRA
ncbi:hypothetical protein [Streptomyces glycanivorans]|uniref:Uncharacterized protein n=1 Tax=Streptomyces glycanivorans TaxID=3033808 RepID=A0ABY9JRC5_9ACTN|nr:hypothetical protein [Streptomyces sp. Alt3]WLQ68547.1 hypothetical protein P8A20_35555 [Streptomyces sp. Alt3]